ncbi:N-acetylmuramoyl-L-alanine amidase [Bradyrhizobium sp. 2TAF24]|uniref:N-acetylmuramoyl-L-alanine amidase n=1 Tax=Bradyrhizobium sp. 2TAF24 TaxID=3233011 RepID=UPI003F93BD8B
MASRANQHVWLRAGLLCAAALLCLASTASLAAGAQASQPTVASAYPVASDVRIAGDDKQTRFILDLDRRIDVRAFALADPYRIILDVPQVSFQLASGTGQTGRGLIKAFRYGLVMPGGSRIVFDLTGPARIEKAFVLDAANGQPSRLIVELAATDKAGFKQALAADGTPALRPALDERTGTTGAVVADAAGGDHGAEAPDSRPVIVIDPGHGGIDNGTMAPSGEAEKTLVLDFAMALRAQIEKTGKYRVVMTRSDDTFIPLGDRVKVARNAKAALFVSIHADALPRGEGDAQGATIYTLSDKASDAEAERLAESENKADAIAGVNLTEEPTDVADILIDLAQRETRTFSNRFARLLAGEMKSVARMHKHPLKSAGFKVLKAPDVPSVLVEIGYVSNKDDLQHLVSDSWRTRTVGSVGQAIEAFFGKRVVSSGSEH